METSLLWKYSALKFGKIGASFWVYHGNIYRGKTNIFHQLKLACFLTVISEILLLEPGNYFSLHIPSMKNE